MQCASLYHKVDLNGKMVKSLTQVNTTPIVQKAVILNILKNYMDYTTANFS